MKRGVRSATCYAPTLLALSAVVSLASCNVIELEESWKVIDSSPTWSPLGHEIAYVRGFASSDGPPGLYVISTTTGVPTFLSGQGLRGLAFSPNGESIAAVDADGIVVLDRATGATTARFSTDNIPNEPDWNPSGSKIVYVRNALDPGEPADSAGLHIIDLETGVDVAVRSGGQVVIAGSPRWSPADSVIAFIGTGGLFVAHPDGSGLRQLTNDRDRPANAPCWIEGGRRILYNRESAFGLTVAVDVTTAGTTTWPITIPIVRSISPEDSACVFAGREPWTDENRVVLFTRRLKDSAGTSKRQLTRFEEPAVTSGREAP
jgi:Tol biopolymer transport system component